MASRGARWIAPFAAAVLIGAAAGALVMHVSDDHGAASASPTAPAASTTRPSASTTPTTAAAAVGAQGLIVIAGTANGKSPCERALPNAASPGEVGAGTGGSDPAAAADVHGPRGMVVQQPLTHVQRVQLQQQLAAARTVIAKYPTVAKAEAAGYMQSTVYVPCIGAHYTNITLAGSFDPSKPAELLYDGTSPNSKIVGLSYLVFHHLSPPPGFAGSNDLWHQHNANGGLCLKGGFVIGSESTSRQQCAAMGGRKTLLTDVWMLHAWVVPGFSCSWGVFSGECPALGGELCGNSSEAPDPSSTSQCGKAAAQSFGS